MSYLDDLSKQVQAVFDQTEDWDELQEKVLEFVQAKSRESFKNGLGAARNRQAKSKGQKAKQA